MAARRPALSVCPVCRRSITVTVAGLVRVHGPVSARCAGSREAPCADPCPATDVDVDVVASHVVAAVDGSDGRRGEGAVDGSDGGCGAMGLMVGDGSGGGRGEGAVDGSVGGVFFVGVKWNLNPWCDVLDRAENCSIVIVLVLMGQRIHPLVLSGGAYSVPCNVYDM